MKKTRLVIETRECRCACECDNGFIYPVPLSGININSIGKYCLKQGVDKDETCSFLEWTEGRELKIKSVEVIEGVEYVKIKKSW